MQQLSLSILPPISRGGKSHHQTSASYAWADKQQTTMSIYVRWALTSAAGHLHSCRKNRFLCNLFYLFFKISKGERCQGRAKNVRAILKDLVMYCFTFVALQAIWQSWNMKNVFQGLQNFERPAMLMFRLFYCILRSFSTAQHRVGGAKIYYFPKKENSLGRANTLKLAWVRISGIHCLLLPQNSLFCLG